MNGTGPRPIAKLITKNTINTEDTVVQAVGPVLAADPAKFNAKPRTVREVMAPATERNSSGLRPSL